MKDNSARDIGAYALKAEITFTKLTKDLLELDEVTYKKCVVLIRRRELMSSCMRIKKIYAPTRNGTKVIFELVKNIDDLINEFVDIYKNIDKFNMSHEELEEGLEW